MDSYQLYRSAHTDYLRVSHQEVLEVGMVQDISEFSRIDQRYVYLDGEVDIPKYLHRKLGHPLLSSELTSMHIREQRILFAQCQEVEVSSNFHQLPPYSIIHLTSNNHALPAHSYY